MCYNMHNNSYYVFFWGDSSMVQELEEDDLILRDYASKCSIYDLTSEDIIKLSRVNSIGLIAKTFCVSTDEFMKVREQHGLQNIYLEDSIRNMEVILYHFDSGSRYFSNNVRNKIIDRMINIFGKTPSKKDFYLRELSKCDFSREKVKEDLITKNIDIDDRMKEMVDFIPQIEMVMNFFIEKEKDYLIRYNNQSLYNQLREEKNQGRKFTREDLTYDTLFELSVIENVPDSLIGELCNLSKGQVRYLRIKVGLSNLQKIKILTYPEILIYYMEENKQRPVGATNEDCEKIVYQLVNTFYKTSDDVAVTDNNVSDEITIDVLDEKVTYYVHFSDEKYSVNTTNKKRKSNGHDEIKRKIVIQRYCMEKSVKKLH